MAISRTIWKSLLGIVLALMSAFAWVLEPLKSSLKDWAPRTTEQSLKEIEATGSALSQSRSAHVHQMQPRRDSAARRHVQMLKSLGNLPLAA